MVSLTGAYAKLHPKLVRSYTLEALLDDVGRRSPSAPPPRFKVQRSRWPPGPHSAFPIPTLAKAFLAEIAAPKNANSPPSATAPTSATAVAPPPQPSTLNPQPSAAALLSTKTKSSTPPSSAWTIPQPSTLNPHPTSPRSAVAAGISLKRNLYEIHNRTAGARHNA